jgi:16S rRNA (guanine(527)-N(7))-methyltransferase RsmG
VPSGRSRPDPFAGQALDFPRHILPPLLAYLDRMLVENQKLNLTAIRDREQALVLHVLDSLQVWAVVAKPPQLILDLGSGNGFPGVAAACLWSDARTVLVERTQKKAAAIVRCLSDVGPSGIEVLPLDASQLPARRPDLAAGADLVLARAFGTLAQGIELAEPLMRRHGSMLVQWKAAQVAVGERNDALNSARPRRLRALDDFCYVLPEWLTDSRPDSPPEARPEARPESAPRARRLVLFERP